jgi:hypothetical protein
MGKKTAFTLVFYYTKFQWEIPAKLKKIKFLFCSGEKINLQILSG